MSSEQHPPYAILAADGPSEVVDLDNGSKRFIKQLVKGSYVDPMTGKMGGMKLDLAWAKQVVPRIRSRSATPRPRRSWPNSPMAS